MDKSGAIGTSSYSKKNLHPKDLGWLKTMSLFLSSSNTDPRFSPFDGAVALILADQLAASTKIFQIDKEGVIGVIGLFKSLFLCVSVVNSWSILSLS